MAPYVEKGYCHFFQQHLLTSCLSAVILVIILVTFQILYGDVCYGDRSSVILDITVVIVLGAPKTHI